MLLGSEDRRHPVSSLVAIGGTSGYGFASPLSVFVLSCQSVPYCQLCFLVSLFYVGLCLVSYFEIIGQASSASSIPLDLVLQHFKDFQEKANSSGDSVFPRMKPHLPLGWVDRVADVWVPLAGHPVLSHLLSHSIGCPWCASLSMCVSLSFCLVA